MIANLIPRSSNPALQVEVLNSDLAFVAEPLMLGHYRSLALSGTEWVMDGLMGGALTTSLRTGLYADEPGSHTVFVNRHSAPDNPWRAPRPQAVVVVGLGDESTLTASALRRSVCQGALAWCQRLAGDDSLVCAAGTEVRLAATLIGSGGRNIGVGQAAQQIALGVADANARLEELNDAAQSTTTWPRIGQLVLVELYLDRAGEAWRALQALAQARPGCLALADAVRGGAGALRRPTDDAYRGTDHELISALPEREGAAVSRISYVLSTRRARSELHAHSTQLALVRDLIDSAATHDNHDPQLGRTLYSLLVPADLDNALTGATSLVMELATRADATDTSGGTAAIPWELLDQRPERGDAAGAVPLAIECKLLRKLRLVDFRQQLRDAHPGDGLLVVGEPQCDPTLYAPLDAARAEAEAVAEGFTQAVGAQRVALVNNGDARQILNTLYARDWRIVHIAGHGEAPGADDPHGVVLTGGSFLGPREIQAMRVVPELVFVNCCHLASFRPPEGTANPTGSAHEPPLPYNRAAFAANVAEALMRIGVRCVIAAGWAVEDEPAQRFATTFYGLILRGERFITAVAEARRAAWVDGRGGNTWAAYQCYGDPDWVFDGGPRDALRPTVPLPTRFAGIASPPGLTLALEGIAASAARPQSESALANAGDQLRHLEARFEARWGGIGAVAEAFGLAWSAVGDTDRAITWYAAAAGAADASASMKVLEQLSNLLVRQAWRTVRHAPVRTQRRAAEQAMQTIEAQREQLSRLLQSWPTAERASLCGAASKRLAMVHALLGQRSAEQQALADMQAHYEQAFALAPGAYYPGLNLLAGQWRCGGALDAAHLVAVRRNLAEHATATPDFWCLTGQVELQLLEALADGSLARRADALKDAFADLQRRVGTAWLWDSVHEQASFLLANCQGRAERALLDALGRWARVPA